MTHHEERRRGFSNIKREYHEPIELEIQGIIPAWLQGSLYRNGPGVFDFENEAGKTARTPHWFDGLTVLHKFTIEGSKVKYQSRKMVPKIEEYVVKNGSYPGVTFGSDPCKTTFQKVSSVFIQQKPQGEDNVGVTIGMLRDKLISKTDANSFLEIDPETLELKQLMDYAKIDPRFTGPLSASHSQTDLETGEFFNFTTDLGRTGTYNVFSISSQESRLLATYAATPAYIHSFGLTKSYMVMIHWPLNLSPIKILTSQSVMGAMHWDASQPTTFVVIDRSLGRICGRYSAPSFYAFHTINCFEDSGNLILDISTYNDAEIVSQLSMANIDNPNHKLPKGQVRRFTLSDVASLENTETRQAHQVELYSGTLELARFNQNFHLKPYRFTYGIAVNDSESAFGAVVKLNVETKETIAWKKPGMYPGEAIFVPNPEGVDEDDGVLLTVVLNGEADHSELIVLDATTMQEIGRATVPITVPFGFHGNFFGEERTDC